MPKQAWPTALGKRISTLFQDAIIHDGALKVSIQGDESYRFYLSMHQVNASYSQSSSAECTYPPEFAGKRLDVGKDGASGKEASPYWKYSPILKGDSIIEIVGKSWFHGASQRDNGIRLSAYHYTNGIALHMEFDDQGSWHKDKNHGAPVLEPDNDYDDKIIRFAVRIKSFDGNLSISSGVVSIIP